MDIKCEFKLLFSFLLVMFYWVNLICPSTFLFTYATLFTGHLLCAGVLDV